MSDNLFVNPPLDFLFPKEEISKDDFVEFSKKMTNLLRKAHGNIPKKCHLCNEDISSFCNSHTLPQFCLKNIAEKGMVMSPSSILGTPILEKDTGVAKTGIFHLICNKCDNEKFSEYETPEKYLTLPSRKMLAQIAMKNALRAIYKRYTEIAVYKELLKDIFFDSFLTSYIQGTLNVAQRDFEDYKKDLNYAKKSLEKDINDGFYLGFYKKVDYIIPIASQTEAVLISDLGNNLVNNIYNSSKSYHLQPSHICLFPLDGYSVIFMFVKEGHTRLRNFFKTLNQLPDEEQLHIISYLVFLYSEDVYISKNIEKIIKSYTSVKNVVNTSNFSMGFLENLECLSPFEQIKPVQSNHRLDKINDFPNLLSDKFKID